MFIFTLQPHKRSNRFYRRSFYSEIPPTSDLMMVFTCINADKSLTLNSICNLLDLCYNTIVVTFYWATINLWTLGNFEIEKQVKNYIPFLFCSNNQKSVLLWFGSWNHKIRASNCSLLNPNNQGNLKREDIRDKILVILLRSQVAIIYRLWDSIYSWPRKPI